MNEERLRRALRDAEVPDADGAAERGLRVVRASGAAAEAAPGRGRRRAGRAAQLALVAALAVAVVSPAGAAVRHWVRDAVDDSAPPALPALTSLPSPGSLLVDSPQGPWVVHGDGSKRLLGAYSESTWSPHGLYVAVTGGGQLTAVEPDGTVRWALSRARPVRDPAWSADGERIAYLEGEDLRLVAGDGSGDRLLAAGVSPLAPAWRPAPEHELTYVDGGGRLRSVLVDTGRAAWTAAPPPGLTSLAWSADGSRLLLTAPGGIEVRGSGGEPELRLEPPAGTRFADAAISGEGAIAAIAESRSGSRAELLLYEAGSQRRLFSGLGALSQVLWSPDGRWLLATWRSADQWLFLNPERPNRIVAVADIAAQFNPGASSSSAFPHVAGWCCPPR